MILSEVVVTLLGVVVVGVVPVGRVDLGVMLIPCNVTGNPVVLWAVVEGEWVVVVVVKSSNVVPVFNDDVLLVKSVGVVVVLSSNVVLVNTVLLVVVVVDVVVDCEVEDVVVVDFGV